MLFRNARNAPYTYPYSLSPALGRVPRLSLFLAPDERFSRSRYGEKGQLSSLSYGQALPVEDDLRRELSQLVADHLLGDGHVVVHLAIVHLKFQPDEVGQNGRRACLCPDRWGFLPCYGTCDGKPMREVN